MMQNTAILNPVELKYDVNFKSRPLGKGMFGDVFQATKKETGETVAIKKIAKRFTNDDSFQREMDNLLFLEQTGGHPSICALREHFDPPGDDHFYLVLDLVEGGELFDHLCEFGAYSEADAARVIRQTASALAFLHGVGMVHSDLKPENLMLSSKDGGDATVKLVDFGCAHLHSDAEDESGSGKDKDHSHSEHRGTGLTPAYCPPEVLSFKKWNPRSHAKINPSYDLWSLGIVMYVMLTGTHPFDLENNASNSEMEKNILSGAPLPIRNSEYTSHLSEDALSLLEKLMSRDPSQRPSAEELLEHPWVKGDTASSSLISGSDKRLWAFQRHATQIGTTVFKGLLRNSDRHGGSQQAKRTNILEMAFRDLDPKNRGYVSTKELGNVTSFLAADAKLSLNELQHLLKDTMAPQHFSKGAVIYDESSKGDSMYILQSGTVEVTSKADGFKTTRQSGEFFGEEVLLGPSGEYSHTAKCLTPVQVLEISREYYEKCIRSDEEVGATMAEIDRTRQRERAKVIFGLQDSLKTQKVEPGDIIFREGSDGDLLYILDKGEVDITVGGRKVRSLRTGEMTGEHAAFYANKAYNVTAQCVSGDGCTMQLLDGKKIREMCKNNSDLNNSFRDIILRRDFKKALVRATGRNFPENQRTLREAFDILDINKSGKLEFDAIKEAVLQWDKSYTESDIKDMLKSLDTKSQGHLTWDEFRRIFSMFNEM